MHESSSSLADPVLSEGPVEGQPLTEAGALGWLPRTCFKHGPPGQTGLELEFVVHDRPRPEGSGPARGRHHLPADRLAALHEELHAQPLHGRITTEPGGQVELSSQPATDLLEAVHQVSSDLAVMAPIAERHGAWLLGAGIDPLAQPPRSLQTPRYDAMEAYLDQWGVAGRTMMRSTASVQVNVEAGRAGRGPDDLRRRWDLLHAIGPALIAVFGTSRTHAPLTAGGGASTGGPAWGGYANLRQGVWQGLDPARCAPLFIGAGETLPQAWARWALDAPLMLVERPGSSWAAPPGLTFRQWLRAGQAAVPDRPAATLSDLRLHLTTLFPPVRARGHLEVRYLDAQPGRWWRVPAAVITALLDDDAAGDAALLVSRPTAGRWAASARLGLADPDLAAAGSELMRLATVSLRRDGLAELADLTEQYRTRWTSRARTPGDDPDGGESTPW